MADSSASVQPGSQITLHFSITLEDGTEAESTFRDDPVEITLGQGELKESLEKKLLGLRAGDKRTFELTCDEGFGPRDPSLIHTLDRNEFPRDMQLKPGLIVGFTTPAGDEVPGLILDLQGGEVNVDFNHPLAGHQIAFTVQVLSIKPN